MRKSESSSVVIDVELSQLALRWRLLLLLGKIGWLIIYAAFICCPLHVY